MTTRCRVYTERLDNVSEITARHFDAFTVLHADGMWHGTGEESVVIETIVDTDTDRCYQLARDLRDTNRQETVMVTTEPVNVTYV